MSNINNKLIFNKYKTKRLIYSSNYSLVYEGINKKENELVVMKFEKNNSIQHFLESEAFLLFSLQGFGIPRFITFGKIKNYSVLVEELLGQQIYSLWKSINNKTEKIIKYVSMLALQALDRLEYIHSKFIIHRDIKPHNFVIGRKDPEIIYIIDFGFARKYRSSRTGKHIKYNNIKYTYGSLKFISINGNKGYEQSRRDDLESLGYMLIYLAKKYLPWEKAANLTNVKLLKRYEEVLKIKNFISPKYLCKGLPEEFEFFIKYCKNLEFEQDPDYNYLRSLFTSILNRNGFKNDLIFFWNKKIKIEKVAKSTDNKNKIHQRKETPQKRLYNKIKLSLEKERSLEKVIGPNNLHLQHVSNFNIIDKNIFQNNNNDNCLIKANYESNIINIKTPKNKFKIVKINYIYGNKEKNVLNNDKKINFQKINNSKIIKKKKK